MTSATVLSGCGASDDDWDDDDFDWEDDWDDWDEDDEEDDNQGGSNSGTPDVQTRTDASVRMSVENTGNLNIVRNNGKMSQNVPMGEDGTWTIFVYLCGSDLESENGMGSMDMEEMQSASTTQDVKFVVQTGGAYSWENDVDANKTERYVICDGDIELVDQKSDANMSDSATLADFVSWGVANYPAGNMGLVFWNHGGGSVSGVCFDERKDGDSLSLREIDAALLGVSDKMTEKFEFIGFDACLMATLETANVVATYANYMYASEETEPGYGWDYTAIGNYLGSNSYADGADLGITVAKSFYDCCKQIDEESGATFSITDLSKIDTLLVAFNNFSQGLHEVANTDTGLNEIVRNCRNVDNFGGNNKAEGYTNMIDLGGFVNACAGQAAGASTVTDALKDAMVYVVNGSDHSGASGLSMYYPIMIQGSQELSAFREISTSPYYLGIVDLVAYGAANAGDISNYSEADYDDWGDYSYTEDEDGNYAYSDDDDDYYDYYSDVEQSGNSSLITFAQKPALDEDGSYVFVLDDNGLNNAVSVQCFVYQLSSDGEDLISLGVTTDCLQVDWSTGEVYDLFDGYWFSLPDGQNLCAYIVDEQEDYGIYTSPVRINGKDTNLRFTVNYSTGDITIDGAWDGVDSNGMAARDVYKLQNGDVIVPVYDAISASGDSDEEFVYLGYEYTYSKGDVISYGIMEDADYAYGYYIDDTYGDYYTTEYVWFNVEDGEVYFYVED